MNRLSVLWKKASTSFAAIQILFFLFSSILFAGKASAQCAMPVIDGEINVCLNSTYDYRIGGTPLSQLNLYVWTLSGGGTMSGSNESRQIQWTQAGTWNLSVYHSDCGPGLTKNIVINVVNSPVPPTPAAIIAAPSACVSMTRPHSSPGVAGITKIWKVKAATFPFTEDTSIPVTPHPVNPDAVNIQWTKAGAFKVMAYANNGFCVSPAPAVLEVGVGAPPQPIVNYTSKVCTSSSVTYTITNPFPGSVYTWSKVGNVTLTTNPGTLSATVTFGASTTSATISVYGTNGLCGLVSSTLNFSVSSVAQVTGPALSGNASTICRGASVLFTTSTSTTDPRVWTITPNTFSGNTTTTGSTASFVFLQAGTYDVKVQTQNGGCLSTFSNTVSVVVDDPALAPVITGITNICPDVPTTLTVSNAEPGITYRWTSDANTLIDGSPRVYPTAVFEGTSASVESGVAGPHAVVVTAVKPGPCASPFTTSSVRVAAPSNSPVSEIEGASTACIGDNMYMVFFEPFAFLSYAWSVSGGGTISSPNSPNTVINWTTPGTYNLTCTITSSCSGVIQVRTKEVIVNPGTPPATSPITGPPTVCKNDISVFTVPDDVAYSYDWTSTGEILSTSRSGGFARAMVRFSTTYVPGMSPDRVSVKVSNASCEAAMPRFRTVISEGPKPQTGSFSAIATKSYVDAPFLLTATSSSPLPFTYTSSNPAIATVSGNIVTITGVGTTTITASKAADNCWNEFSAQKPLTVDKASLTAAANNKSRMYGDADPVFTFSYSGFKASEDVSVLDTPPSATVNATATSAPGSYTITPYGGLDNHYAFSFVNGAMSITKAALTATAENKTKLYGDINPPLTLSYSGFRNGETAPVIDVPPSASTTATTASVPGQYPIEISGGSDNNYSISLVNGTLNVGKASLAVTANNATKVYGESNPALGVTFTGFKNGDDESDIETAPLASTLVSTSTGVGNYPIIANGGVDDNYTFIYTDGSLSVTQAPLTVACNNGSKIYGDQNPTLTASYTGFKGNDDVSVLSTLPVLTTTAVTNSPVNNYPITSSGGAAANYNIIHGAAGTLSVTKAQLTVTPDDKGRIYGDPNPALTFAYSGFKGSDDVASLTSAPIASTTAVPSSTPSIYPITTSGGSALNYSFNYGTANLTIAKATLTATADNKTKIYGNSTPPLTISYSGFKLGQSVLDLASTKPVASTSALQMSGVGTYSISPSGGVDANYSFNYVDGILSISKAILTVTANNKSKVYLDPNPTLTVSYSGFLSSDSVTVLDTRATASTPASNGSNAGNYAITACCASDNNYHFIYVDGTLTVNKRDQTVTLASIPSKNVGDVFTVNATASSGLPVSFSSNNAYASVSGNTVTAIDPRTGSITAMQPGDSNYNPASDTKTFGILAVPVAPITGPHVWCGLPITLSTAGTNQNPGCTYLWSNGATTSQISANAPGTYWVKVTNANGLTVTSSNWPISDSRPVISGPSAVCSSTTTSLTSTSGSGYLWFKNGLSMGMTTKTISVTQSADYYVRVTNPVNCGTVTVNALPVHIDPSPSVALIGYLTFCSGNQARMQASTNNCSGCTYSWSGGGTSANKNTSTAGTHTVTVTNPAGCSVSSSATVTMLSNVSMGSISSTATCMGTSQVNLTANPNGSSFKWYRDGFEISLTTRTIPTSLAGNYFVEINGGLRKGCFDLYPCPSSPVERRRTEEISEEEPELFERVQLFPNPADDELVIQIPLTGYESMITLYSETGIVTDHFAVEPESTLININTRQLKAGIYIIQLETVKGITRKKVTVTHSR